MINTGIKDKNRYRAWSNKVGSSLTMLAQLYNDFVTTRILFRLSAELMITRYTPPAPTLFRLFVIKYNSYGHYPSFSQM